MFYVYLIKNSKNNTYIGYTNDLRRRIKEHKSKNPELIYYEAYKNEKDAKEREKKLKQRGQTVRRLKERLKNSFQ
ncbi:MAG: excinuclease ABC subunit C [Candidatus Nealsonbacteria bacterium CG23_combo_of_CG06-09_8_20_14_all_37_18]|uniref:Excinuclease ABC subunit C n=1 Tax=Candidatus Nealsonbacteria bacterium CG23_combo_of_CG06-09_8_20_14_all_37_18 TaxID=1974720 RepID=A0A2G9Z095_9BACT|nr:MAG: excinuclease ABC subunit C [Candidatus Nealsonbacteria bacterium CG23_combo_of_CG06-09_8_20_14_all_37_18]